MVPEKKTNSAITAILSDDKIYSKRNASTGFNLEAVLAGQTPKTTPTNIEKPREARIIVGLNAKFH
jgi:hypothetical protein